MVYKAPLNKDEGDLTTGTRVCRSCEERKSMAVFQWTADRKYRVRVCTACQVVKARERRDENREQVTRNSFITNLRTKYAMTEEDYHSLMAAQGGGCAICRDDFSGGTPHVDHCHQTGAVRGILCFRCNTAIGKLRDDPALLRAAATYLEQPPPVLVGRSRQLTPEERRATRSRAAAIAHATPEGQANRRNRPRGERNSAARLTDQAAVEIRARYLAGGVSQQALADEYGCSQGLVSKVVLGKLRVEVAAVSA